MDAVRTNVKYVRRGVSIATRKARVGGGEGAEATGKDGNDAGERRWQPKAAAAKQAACRAATRRLTGVLYSSRCGRDRAEP